jgi:hypothetical protein
MIRLHPLIPLSRQQLVSLSQFSSVSSVAPVDGTLIKNKIKFSSYIGKFRVEQLQLAKSYMTNGLLIYGKIFSHFLIY